MITRETVSGTFPVKRLGDVAEFLDSMRRPVKESDRKPGPYPYYGANGKQGTIDGFIFDEPLILLAEDGGHFDAPERGIAYRISGKSWVNNHAHIIKPKKDVDLAFLCRVLENYDVTPFISGSTRAKLTKGQAEKIEIPLPPIEEQKRIAAILDQADSLRRLRQRAIDRLNTLGQAIFYEMFGDPRANPNGYPIRTLGDLGEVKLGKMLDKGKKRGNTALPYLRNANVQWFGFDLYDVLEMDFWDKERERYRVLPGDLLICEGGQPGRCAIWKDESIEIYYQKALHRARFDENAAMPEYVAYWLRRAVHLGMLVDSVSTATIAHLTGEKLKQLQLMLPPIAEQRSFASKLNEWEEELEKMHSAAYAGKKLFSSLQNRAFHGSL